MGYLLCITHHVLHLWSWILCAIWPTAKIGKGNVDGALTLVSVWGTRERKNSVGELGGASMFCDHRILSISENMVQWRLGGERQGQCRMGWDEVNYHDSKEGKWWVSTMGSQAAKLDSHMHSPTPATTLKATLLQTGLSSIPQGTHEGCFVCKIRIRSWKVSKELLLEA